MQNLELKALVALTMWFRRIGSSTENLEFVRLEIFLSLRRYMYIRMYVCAKQRTLLRDWLRHHLIDCPKIHKLKDTFIGVSFASYQAVKSMSIVGGTKFS
jgi:hypothetical protein